MEGEDLSVRETTAGTVDRPKNNYNNSQNNNRQRKNNSNQITFFVDVQQNEVARLVGRGGANST